MAAESGGEYFFIKRLTRTAQPKTKILLSYHGHQESKLRKLPI